MSGSFSVPAEPGHEDRCLNRNSGRVLTLDGDMEISSKDKHDASERDASQ